MLSCLLCLFWTWASGQVRPLSFHKLGISEGLHDGTVRGIGQDKYGFVWIATVGALNRFDGSNVEHFTHRSGDSTSAYGSQPRCIHKDKEGRLWIGFETGLMEFEYEHRVFKRVQTVKDVFISKIISVGDSLLYLATRRGLIRYNTHTGSTFFYANSLQPSHSSLQDLTVLDLKEMGGNIYMATMKGLAVLNTKTDSASLLHIDGFGQQPIYTMAFDKHRNLWLGTHQQIKLMKLDPTLKSVKVYDRFLTSDINTQALNVMEILVDRKNRTWVVTAIDGLMEYLETEDRFIKHLHNPHIPASPSANNYRALFEDRQGMIWLGCDYVGVNYFEPDRFLFETILPFPDKLDQRARGVARAVTEDREGNLWMGTHDGVSRYHSGTRTYTTWRNEPGKKDKLYNNVVRSIWCDKESNVWIGTASGVNRYNAGTGQMEFIPEKDLPIAYYNSITPDSSGNLWFCCNSFASLHWYNMATRKFYSILDHPLLKAYAGITPTSYVLEDNKRRLWISWARRGVLMLDKQLGKVKQYQASDTPNHGIIGNQVVDIKEDKSGWIWVTTLNGFSGINPDNDSIISFSNLKGLPGNWCAPMAIDRQNRIWVGVNGGLVLLSADRRKLTRFSLADGLPSVGFPEHAGITLRNGQIMFPTYNGFVRFHPDHFTNEKRTLNTFIAGYSLFDKQYNLPPGNPLASLRLKADQNDFAFHMVALNYVNPHETWFAYKLEGFEKEWHITQDVRAVYTNVPGGSYTFLLKASVGNGGWEDIEPRRLSIKLDTLFYNSTWFWAMLALLAAGGLYSFMRYRSAKEHQLFLLQGKAQNLEKEKALVMYDSLKQQLNPHFLFNSLTSLSGLIETNQEMAVGFLAQMSSIYRYILKNANNETVSLKDELEFVQHYIDLQQTRFGDGLEVSVEVPNEYLHYRIAPVTLQNLVENAIKHNIIDVASPLLISFTIEGDYLLVSNNLQRKNMVETSNRTGLQQFKSLYRFLTEKQVLVEEEAGLFVVKIPLV